MGGRRDIERDHIVVAEVMTDDIDRSWWSSYRAGELEARFHRRKTSSAQPR